MFYTYTTNQQMHIYQYVQSHIINLHPLVSVTPVTITGCLQKEYNQYKNNFTKMCNQITLWYT
jgi:hypothetical protein